MLSQQIAALRGPHGEVAALIDVESDYLGTPGATIFRMSGAVVVPLTSIGTEWHVVPGRVRVCEKHTGRWTTPVERHLCLVEAEAEAEAK